MFLRQDTLSVLKSALLVGAVFVAIIFYDSSQEKQDLVDRCVKLMIFQAAKFDGYWVETDDLSTRYTDGRLVIMASASGPIKWKDLDKESADLEAELQDDSLYLIRCTVYQNGAMTSLVVEKYTPARTWEFVDPGRDEKIEENIEELKRRMKSTKVDQATGVNE